MLSRRFAVPIAALLVLAACSDAEQSTNSTAAAPTDNSPTTIDIAEQALAYSEYGDFPVGVTTLQLAKGPKVEIWYPAAAGTSGTETYDMRDFVGEGIRAILTGDAPSTYSYPAGRDALLADGSFPVVLFSHGVAGMRLQSSFLTSNLASWGMIVVSVDPQANLVRLLSIPRDLWVFIPGHGYNRVNTADLWGELDRQGSGPERVKQTIHHNLGIPIHYYVRIDFAGFISIIDAVGGIDVDVECPLPDISLTAGMHHMNGQDALRYARSRKSTNDFDRARRQRKVLMALWDQALTLDIIPRIPDLWRAMSNTFQTDMTLDQVINMAYLGVQLKPQRILSRAIGPAQVQSWVTPEGAAVLLPRQEELRAMLQNFYAPLDTTHLDDSSKVRVRVLNGSPRKQAQDLAASALAWEGYKVVGRGAADRPDYAQTVVQAYNGSLAAATEIARALGVPTTAVQDMAGATQPDPANPVDVVVVLGANYNPCR